MSIFVEFDLERTFYLLIQKSIIILNTKMKKISQFAQWRAKAYKNQWIAIQPVLFIGLSNVFLLKQLSAALAIEKLSSTFSTTN